MDLDGLREAKLVMTRMFSTESLQKQIVQYIDQLLSRKKKAIEEWEEYHERMMKEINEDIQKAQKAQDKEGFKNELKKAKKHMKEGNKQDRDYYEAAVEAKNNKDYTFFYDIEDEDDFLYANFKVLKEREEKNKLIGGKPKRAYAKKRAY